MNSLAITPKLQFFTAAGVPLVGGKLYTYEAGTTTPLATYADANGSATNTNPVILDARGEANVWLPVDQYKFVLKDSTNVEIWTVDNIPSDAALSTLAEANGATLIGYTTPTGSVTTVAAALNTVLSSPAIVLSSNRTYYVRTDGNDSNTGLINSALGAFKTIQKAIDTTYLINFNNYDVTIQVGNGTYTAGGSFTGNHFGGGNLFVYGNLATPSSCIVTVASGNCFSLQSGAQVTIKGFKLISATGSGIQIFTSSGLSSGNCDFGTCASMHIDCGTGSTVIMGANYDISGSATGHLHCGSFGYVSAASTITVNISNTPAFSAYFIGVAQGTVAWGGPTVTGTATGPKYLAHNGGIIMTPQSFSYSSIPGSITGVNNAAGFILGSTTAPITFAPDVYTNNSLAIQSINFNAQTYNNHFVTTNDLTQGTGNFYCNGTDSYSTGRTNFCFATPTDVTTGTTDGATFSVPGYVNLQMSNNSLEALRLRRRTTDGSIVSFYRDTTNVGNIAVSTTATAYYTSSDYRLKENVAPMTGALETISKLKPVTYRWKNAQINAQGFIAHELQDVFPEAVSGKKDGVDKEGNPEYQAIDTSFVVATLTKAVQELLAKVTDLEEQVIALGVK